MAILDYNEAGNIADLLNILMEECRGHVILARKYKVSPHVFTEVPFPVYCALLLKATLPLKLRGFLALIFGAILDMFWRVHWLLKYRTEPRTHEKHTWTQIQSTKRW